MFRHSTNTASFFSVLIAVLMFWLSLAGVAAAQDNTSLGTGALVSNTTGDFNTAIGVNALLSNTTGDFNTASGVEALFSNTTGAGLQHRQRSRRARSTAAATPPTVIALFSNTTASRHRSQCAL